VEPQNTRQPTASSTDTMPPPAAPVARELSWANALRELRQRRAQLAELRNKGTVRMQRLLGRATTLLPPTPFGVLCGVFDTLPLTAENILLGYAQGIYPLERNGTVRWHCPPERYVVYLRELEISSNMQRALKRADYTVTFDRAPREVIAQCTAEHASGQGTWLSERLGKIYLQLFEMGAMHTVEAWQGGTLVGGSFGVTIGTVWTSESMFHHAPHAGKVQFQALAQRLLDRGFELVDGQQYTEHFARFGARDISIAEYRAALARGLAAPARFYPKGTRPVESATSAEPGGTAPGKPARNTATRDTATRNTATRDIATRNTAARKHPKKEPNGGDHGPS
jgi:leucyl/phenylalanyl-tRNA---protein transferase